MKGHRNPFEGVTDFFSELNRMRDLGRHGYEHAHEDRERTHATAWVPAADIFARAGDLVIRIDLAGMRPDDVAITFADGQLTVFGERSTEEDTGGPESFYIRERFYGSFRRAITLPPGTEQSQISAEFENGLVEVIVRGAASGAELSGLRSRTPQGKRACERSPEYLRGAHPWRVSRASAARRQRSVRSTSLKE